MPLEVRKSILEAALSPQMRGVGVKTIFFSFML